MLAGSVIFAPSAIAAQDLPEIGFTRILLADSGGIPAGSARTVSLGSPVLEYALLFETAALADGAARLEGEPWVSAALGLPMREARLAAGDPRAIEGAGTYCTVEIAPPEAIRSARSASETAPRFADKVRACFIDTDNDSRLDRAFFTGARWAADRLGRDIAPIAYRRQEMTPLPGARWRLVVKNEDRTRSLGALGFLSQRTVLQAQVNIPGPGFSEVRTDFAEAQCGMKAIAIDTSIKTSRLPRPYDFGCTRVSITGFDKKAKTITYVIDRHMKPSPVSLTVSFLDIYGGTIYTLN
jgi:hypothetical protein